MSNSPDRPYGTGDASFQAAGGEAGIRKLVDDFFDRMGSDERFATIYDMHPDDKAMSRDKLARFLCGWLGGPKLYHEKYGSISIPGIRHMNHAAAAIRKLRERYASLLAAHEIVYSGPGNDDFLEHYTRERDRLAKSGTDAVPR